MQITVDCFPRLVRQELQASRFANADYQTQCLIIDLALKRLADAGSELPPSAHASTVYELVRQEIGDPDH